MIDRLLIALQQAGLLLSDQQLASLSEAVSLVQDEDIADALWLASKMGGGVVEAPEEEILPPVDDVEPNLEQGEIGLREEVVEGAIAPPPPPPAIPAVLPDATPQPTDEAPPNEGLPIQIQAAPALQDARLIGRAFRPLMRKVPSLTKSTLDEQATVDRIAQRDIWVPVLKPAQERWFDVELVIESSPFSFIWEETLEEFQQVLEQQGAFRNVRTWSLEITDLGDMLLRPRRQPLLGADVPISRSPKELVDAAGRRLVLVVSDCRSPIWQQGNIHDWLKLWSQHGPTAIAQLLPERLWDESELDVGYPAQVSNLHPGAPNDKLQVWELPLRRSPAPQDTLTLPIVTLTEKSLQQWALVVAAAGRQRSPARLFDLNWVRDEERDRTADILTPQSASDRVELFRATASPIAQKLAGMMAAVPVRLPVINLIQKRLLPEAKPIHVAEVFSSGLLFAEEGKGAIAYDFAEGVRGLLNETTPLDETIAVLDELSKDIASTLGLPSIRSFTALLSPKSTWSLEAQAAILPFAQVATQVLQRLGGDYAELAELVEQDATQHKEWLTPSPSESVSPEGSLELQTLNFMTGQLLEEGEDTSTDESDGDFPLLQTEEFAIATVAINDTPKLGNKRLESFEFDVVTIEREEELPKYTSPWEIKRRRFQNHRFIETIGEEFSLEMVAIPGGSFLMGSPEDEEERTSAEGPQHQVTVSPFFMGRHPITQAQWQFVASLPQVARELNIEPSRFKGSDRPVEQVSWYDAVEFCERLSQHIGREYRLPTEAEWEYACRAGTATPFHFGETITTKLANYNGTITYRGGPKGEYRQQTTPIRHFRQMEDLIFANAFGLCDMHGNVYEWCQDNWHVNYEGAPIDGSAWLDKDRCHAYVLRGGSWIYYPTHCRSAYRDSAGPDLAVSPFGFRVVHSK